MIVTLAHLHSIPSRRGAGWCNRGARAWFARHGLDWSAFVREGIDADTLLATGCGMARQLVDWARQCEAEGAAHG